MSDKSQKHLKTRQIKPFNVDSKVQENVAKIVADAVWNNLLKKYPDYHFDNLRSLGMTSLKPEFCVNYLNRGFTKRNPYVVLQELQAWDSADGIKPDGGIFFVSSKKDNFKHIIGALEVKHQGDYQGYTPVSDTHWKKNQGKDKTLLANRPPQAQGNAIERFAKNANAIKTLTSFYGYNPYLVFCEGFDFFLKSDFSIFKGLPHAQRFKDRDSSILMRLIAGNDWLPLNRIYGRWRRHGASVICPATIFARMPKWTTDEIAITWLRVIDQSLEQLNSLGEI